MGAAFGVLFLAGAAVVASADAAITNITDAYVANKNDEAKLAAVESQVAGENAAILKGGPKAADAPGVTAGGQATNEHGQKIAPSGKPQVNEVNRNTREGAKNAANRGSGTIHDQNPKNGDRSHFHPARGDGSKVRDGSHYYYPE